MVRINQQQRRYALQRVNEKLREFKDDLREKFTTSKKEFTKKEKEKILRANAAYGLDFHSKIKLDQTIDEAVIWSNYLSDYSDFDEKGFNKVFNPIQVEANSIKDKIMLGVDEEEAYRLIEQFCSKKL